MFLENISSIIIKKKNGTFSPEAAEDDKYSKGTFEKNKFVINLGTCSLIFVYD